MIHNLTTVDHFIEVIADLRFDDTFNPYAHVCPHHDTRNADAIRRQNLKHVLKAALTKQIDSIWIARDLGYRGGRRTGLALTDEVHLPWHAELLEAGLLKRATKGLPVSERTATVVWHMLRTINRPIFLWNVFPLHPHSAEDPMSNRCHTRAERMACKPMLLWLLDTLQPKNIIAIGRDAQHALESMDMSPLAVRHPSYGGQTEFIEKLSTIYALSDNCNSIQQTLF